MNEQKWKDKLFKMFVFSIYKTTAVQTSFAENFIGSLKGQCHEIFDSFLQKKPGPHMIWQKRFVCKNFRFREDICKKHVSA